MTIEEIINPNDDTIVCWSCDADVLIKELSANDGFCPFCDQEIDLSEYL